MHIFFKKMLQPKVCDRETHGRRPNGQVAIILIILIAILFIFFAVVLNLGRIAQNKTLVTTASNMSAAFMASELTSNAEYLYQSLGGEAELDNDLTSCRWTGVFAAIIAIVVLVASIITFQWHLTVLLIVAIVASVGTLVLQLVYIQPGITDMWNKQWENLQPPDQFLERGINTALISSIDDNTQINDTSDIDMDGLFDSSDKVSRFGYYYTQRLNSLVLKTVDTAVIQNFLDALKEFLFLGSDTWGIWDPICENNPSHPCCDSNKNNNPAECNICCLPDGVTNPNEPDLRFACCDSANPAEYCGTATTCDDNSSLGSPYGSMYPYVFDPNFENTANGAGRRSLREIMGRDDETRRRRTNPPGNFTNIQIADTTQIYHKLDARGIFPTFWDISSKVDLFRMGFSSPAPQFDYGEDFCYWCVSHNYTSIGVNCTGIGGLSLPDACDPVGNPAGCCVKGMINKPPVMDRVTNVLAPPPAGNTMLLRNLDCYNSPTDTSWYKRGADKFCSTAWPYDTYCPGQMCNRNCPTYCGDSAYIDCRIQGSGGCDPSCPTFCGDPRYGECDFSDDIECTDPGADKDSFRGDPVDTLRYDLDLFIEWADVAINTDPAAIATDFTTWYQEADGWLHLTNGQLHKWVTDLTSWRTHITNWRNATTYVGQHCGDDCFPRPVSAGSCPAPGGNGPATATISQIITCLEQKRVYWATLQQTYDNLVAQYNYLINIEIPALNTQIAQYEACYNQCILDQNTSTRRNASWTACTVTCPNCYQTFNTSANNTEMCWKNIGCGCFRFNPLPPPPIIFVTCAEMYCGPGATIPMSSWLLSQRAALITLRDQKVTEANNLLAQINAITPAMRAAAPNNAAKFAHRKNFLDAAYNGAGTIVTQFSTAEGKINAFLNDPRVVALRNEWSKWNSAASTPPPLSPYVIYGWKSPAPQGRTEGYWHVVRVDARVPTRCDGRCGRFGPGTEPRWPWVKTWTKSGGTRRCTALGDSFDMYNECDEKKEYDDDTDCFRGGTAKSRVIRYDEDRDINTTLMFPNNIPIWRFLFHHPQRGAATPQMIADMETACDPGPTKNGAFMIDDIFNQASCWNKVAPLLERGVASQTCAQYFFHDAGPRGFNVKFSKCEGPF